MDRHKGKRALLMPHENRHWNRCWLDASMNTLQPPEPYDAAPFCVSDCPAGYGHDASAKLYKENCALSEEVGSTSSFGEIVGSSESLCRVLGHVAKVAAAHATVLITGE